MSVDSPVQEEAAETADEPEALPRAPKPRVFRRGLSGTGLYFAVFFFALSLFPSILPRPPIVQGVNSGVTTMVG